MASSIGSFNANSFEMNHFPNQQLKRTNRAFDKVSLLFQTALESEARTFLQTVQLDFSWTLEMYDWRNDPFARPSDSLRSSLSSLCTIVFKRNYYQEGYCPDGIINIKDLDLHEILVHKKPHQHNF